MQYINHHKSRSHSTHAGIWSIGDTLEQIDDESNSTQSSHKRVNLLYLVVKQARSIVQRLEDLPGGVRT